MPGNPPVNLRYDAIDGGMLSHITNLPVETVVLPWRAEETRSAGGGTGAARLGEMPENFTSAAYNSDIWAGGFDMPLYAVANAGAIGAGTMNGVEVSFDFMGSVLGFIQTGNVGTSYAFSYPYTAVIDGVAYPADWRTPWVDFPATASASGTGTQRATIVARGLHSGRHRCVLQFAQDPLATTGRTWLINAKILEKSESNRPPPPVEIVQNATEITVPTSSTSPPEIAIRAKTAPYVLGITKLVVTNTTGSALTFYYRPYLKTGAGTSAAYMQRVVPANDSVEIAASAGRFWPQEVQCYGSAAGLVARAYYQR